MRLYVITDVREGWARLARGGRVTTIRFEADGLEVVGVDYEVAPLAPCPGCGVSTPRHWVYCDECYAKGWR